MSRAVEEWIGATDDTAIPARVKIRTFDKADGRCAVCDRAVRGRLSPAYDHIQAIINGGKNCESNLQLLCIECHREKTAGDVAEKSIVARKKAKHIGAMTKRTKIQSAGFRKAAPQRTASRPIVRHSQQ